MSRIPTVKNFQSKARIKWATPLFWYVIDPILRRHHFYYRRKVALDRVLERNSVLTNSLIGVAAGLAVYVSLTGGRYFLFPMHSLEERYTFEHRGVADHLLPGAGQDNTNDNNNNNSNNGRSIGSDGEADGGESAVAKASDSTGTRTEHASSYVNATTAPSQNPQEAQQQQQQQHKEGQSAKQTDGAARKNTRGQKHEPAQQQQQQPQRPTTGSDRRDRYYAMLPTDDDIRNHRSLRESAELLLTLLPASGSSAASSSSSASSANPLAVTSASSSGVASHVSSTATTTGEALPSFRLQRIRREVLGRLASAVDVAEVRRQKAEVEAMQATIAELNRSNGNA